MKKLTMGRMAWARLKANKKAYISMSIGIFLSIFLMATLIFSVYGMFLSRFDQRNETLGRVNLVALDSPTLTDQNFLDSGIPMELGHVYVTGQVQEAYLGYLDASGLLRYPLTDGRFPENAGEIAVNAGMLSIVAPDAKIGDRISLDITPIDGILETREFTLVGTLKNPILNEYLQNYHTYSDQVHLFPDFLISDGEPAFQSGRTAIHHLLYLDSFEKLKALEAYFKACLYPEENMLVIPETGEHVLLFSYIQEPFNGFFSRNNDILALALSAALLGISGTLCCGIGISNAMEGILDKRREEIGILRAVGATKRQIRRMFGRERLVLALLLAPVSVGLGLAAVWALSRVFPAQLSFGFSPKLLILVVVLALVLILASGTLPLHRAANQMPMQVVRDTGILRKAKHLHSPERFSVPKLISRRQLRFQLGKQISAMLLVLCMLLSSCAMVFLKDALPQLRTEGDLVLFNSSWSMPFFDIVAPQDLSESDLLPLISDPTVKSVKTNSYASVNLLTDHYSPCLGEDYTDPEIPEEERVEFDRIQDFLQTNLQIIPNYHVLAWDIAGDEALQASIFQGKINLEALDSGEEVILYLPKVWEHSFGDHTVQYTGPQTDPKDRRVRENDYFYPGQVLSLVQIYTEEEWDAPLHRIDETVTVGAITEEEIDWYYDSPVLLTTEQGLKQMALRSRPGDVEIFLKDGVTPEQEAAMVQKVQALLSYTNSEVSFLNNLEFQREQAEISQAQSILFFAVTLLFFAVACGMMTSNVTRRIQSESREIGMLRAVGANAKDLFQCYAGQFSRIIGTAGILGLILPPFWVCLVFGEPYATVVPMILPVLALSLCLWVLCRWMLWRTVRQTVRRSIIDTIKEL